MGVADKLMAKIVSLMLNGRIKTLLNKIDDTELKQLISKADESMNAVAKYLREKKGDVNDGRSTK